MKINYVIGAFLCVLGCYGKFHNNDWQSKDE